MTNIRYTRRCLGIERTKYNVSKDIEKRTYNNITFDSLTELRYYKDVVLPGLASGEIIECELQKDYILQEKFMRNGKTVQPIKYVADFCLRYSDGSELVIDIKGMADATAKLKRKLFWKVYPHISYQWISFSAMDGGWIDYDELQALRRARKRQLKNHNNKEVS